MCGLCSRLRRGALYRYAAENGITKIALGHHRDDIVETLFLNCSSAGASRPWRRSCKSEDGRHIVIRPLAYVSRSADRALRARAPVSHHSLQVVRLAGKRTAPAGEADAGGLGTRVSRDAPSRSSRRCATSSRRTWRTRQLRLQGSGYRRSGWRVFQSRSLSRTGSFPGRLLAGKYPGRKESPGTGTPPRAAARRGLRRVPRSDRGRRAAALRELSTGERASTCASRSPTMACRVTRPHGGYPGGAGRAARRQAGACTCIAAPASGAPARWWPAT